MKFPRKENHELASVTVRVPESYRASNQFLKRKYNFDCSWDAIPCAIGFKAQKEENIESLYSKL